MADPARRRVLDLLRRHGYNATSFQALEDGFGTMELLVDTAMRAVGEEGAEYVTLGLAPLSGRIPGWLATVRELSAPLVARL